MLALEGAAGFRGATAMDGLLPAGVPGVLAAVLGPETIGAGGGAACVPVFGEVAELGGLGELDEVGGGDDEQPARNTAAAANDSRNRLWRR